MKRREFAGIVAAGLAAAEPPRTIVIFGQPGAAVPDRLAAEGVSFTRAYAACPSVRDTVVSGRFPHARSSPRVFNATVLTSFPATLPPDAALVFASTSRDDTFQERSTHIALAIRHPKLPRGKAFDHPVSTVDVAPTLLALSGAALPEGLHGRDLSELLTTGKGERPESVYVEGGLTTPGEWRMIVRGLDKLVVRRNLDVLHLFNLGEDPDEEHDLAKEIGYRLKVDELVALIRVWMKRTADGMDPSGLRRR
jgi:arylsulfatase A-like enzyme